MGSDSHQALKHQQIAYYKRVEDHEDEVSRPRCYPRAVRFLLDFKLRSTMNMLNGRVEDARVLAVCCGSGMDAEFLACQGMHVVGMDISFEALQRARQRARRYNVNYELVLGDAECMPFQSDAFELAFVHDGLHHLPDAYRGVREMTRVASRAVAIAEPAAAALTRLAVKLRISGNYEEAGNFVYRLRPEECAEIFAAEGASSWAFAQHLIYYQPWTFRIYKLFECEPLFWLFKLGFYLSNFVLARWGNSLKAIAWLEG